MPEDYNPAGWLTTSEAADLSGYSIQYIRRLINAGRIAAEKWGRDWFVSKVALLDYIEEMEKLGPARHDPWRTGARARKDGGD
jgi:excisionase family DNA binding protein